MFRKLSVVLFVMAGGLLSQAIGASNSEGLELGKKFEGELKTIKACYIMNTSGSQIVGVGTVYQYYVSEVPVTLKAGQSIAISATVTGKGRKVALTLLDPTGKPLDSFYFKIKTGQLKFEEVPASGKYTIQVISENIGPFTLRTTGPGKDENDEKALEEKVKELKKELAETEAKLQGLRSKLRLKKP